MSKRLTPEDLNEAMKPWLDIARDIEADRKREAARCAQLTPDQRRAEDEANAAKARAEAAAKRKRKVDKAARAYRGHETLTLREFGHLLHGLNPADYSDWSFMQSNDAIAVIARLERAVGASLHPVNPGDPVNKRRFKTIELLAWARSMGHTGADLLAAALGFRAIAQPSQAASPRAAVPPASQAPPTPQRKLSPRQAAVVDSIEDMIAWAERKGYGPLDRRNLPFRRDDLFKHYESRCKARDVQPLKDTQFRNVMRDQGYRLKPGTDDSTDIRLLYHWRAGEKTKPE
ncbi:MAG: hypothetical protein WD793_13800 [Steroidobacteraceae bacterium]